MTNELETLKQAIIAHAEKATAAYPQYRGNWNSCKLYRVTRQIKTKLGIAFLQGEYTVGRDTAEGLAPEYAQMEGIAGHITCWSRHNEINTVLKASSVEEVA